MAFSFYKAQKDKQAILKSNLIDSELEEILSGNNRSENRITIICFDAFSHKNCGDSNDRDDHVETMDRQDRCNRPIKFLDDSGNCMHMETGLKTVKL